MDAVKGAAKKALAAQEQSLEHNATTTSSLQGIKQVSVVSILFYVLLLKYQFRVISSFIFGIVRE